MPQDIKTVEQLTTLLKRHFDKPSEKEAIKDYKYAIYVRKSTDGTEKQERSIPDQIAECREFAEKNNLYVPKGAIYQEAVSAKEPDIRLRFKEVLDAIRTGKYDGLIAWHPDRLARNMRDAGEIIDLVDKGVIADLKFVSFTFENSPSGKMLLGITFVLSKQYSDQLSVNVHRGNKRSLDEGVYVNKSKHGYFKDKSKLLRPDGNNFLLLKKAFEMRLVDKVPQKDIARYLNESGYTRTSGQNGKKYLGKITTQKVAKILKDPIYAGVLVYGKHVINLKEKYDFEPMLSVEDFMKINKVSSMEGVAKLSSAYRKNDAIKANLLLGMVCCSDCGDSLSAGITPKKLKNGIKRYFYYRCENSECIRKSKGTRAKVIIDFVIDYLKSNPFGTKEAYESYKDEIKLVNTKRLLEKSTHLKQLRARLTSLNIRIENTKAKLVEEDDIEISRAYKSDFKKLSKDAIVINKSILSLRDEIEAHKDIPLTYQDFLELWENMAESFGNIKDMSALDTLIKKIFSNFTVSLKKVIKYKLNEPFNKLENVTIPKCGE